MKLDRNVNRGGHGKYALVNMRKIIPLIEARESGCISIGQKMELEAFEELLDKGFITLGNESPGDQFFVMKYKDKFTADGLAGYAMAVAEELKSIPSGEGKNELSEYAAQMFDESHAARKIGNRIPD